MDEASFPVGAACRIDARTPWRQVAEIPVGLDPEGIAIDAARRRAFVACSRSDFVSVIDLDTHEVVTEIATGAEPIDIGFDEKTGRVFSRRRALRPGHDHRRRDARGRDDGAGRRLSVRAHARS